MCRRGRRRRAPGGRWAQRPHPGGTTGARWATRCDTRPIRSHRPGRQGRLVLGRAGVPGVRTRLLATEARHSVLVVGPTQSGKTSGLAVPGPARVGGAGDRHLGQGRSGRRHPQHGVRSGAVLGVRPDPDIGTASHSPGGRPSAAVRRTGPPPSGWRAGWSTPRRPAPAWPTPRSGTRRRPSSWPHCSLPRRTAGMSMAEVVRVDKCRRLRRAALGSWSWPARRTRRWLWPPARAVTHAIRSSVSTTLETVLAPFEDPVVAASTAACDIDLSRTARRGTAAFTSAAPATSSTGSRGSSPPSSRRPSLKRFERVNASGRPLDPPLLLVLDEAANIAPVRDLDTLASTGAGLGMQLVTVCQDLAQLAARYGAERARTIANNHRAKVLLSGVSDLSTLDMMSGLAGEQAVREETVTHDLRDGRRTRSRATVPSGGWRRPTSCGGSRPGRGARLRPPAPGAAAPAALVSRTGGCGARAARSGELSPDARA